MCRGKLSCWWDMLLYFCQCQQAHPQCLAHCLRWTRRPINRSSLTAHLHRTLRAPGDEGLRASANKALRWLGGAVAFYFAANLVLGGRKRVHHDLHRIKVLGPPYLCAV